MVATATVVAINPPLNLSGIVAKPLFTISGETIDIAQTMDETDRSHKEDTKFEDW